MIRTGEVLEICEEMSNCLLVLRHDFDIYWVGN